MAIMKKVIVWVLVIVVVLVIVGIMQGVFFQEKFGLGAYTPKHWQEQNQIQISEALNQENKNLFIPQTTITLLKEEDYVFAFGIKNINSESLKYQIIIESISEKPIFGSNLSDNFLYEKEAQELQPEKIEVSPISITAEEISGTNLFVLKVMDVTNGEPGTLYASEKFLVTVKD